MPIKGVLFDLDGPLLVDGSRQPRDGIPSLISDLHARSVRVGAMSSQADAGRRLAASGLAADDFRCAKKGTGDIVSAFCAAVGVEPHECLTVFDDEYGFHEAINGRTIGFHAEWGGGTSKYGIRLERPDELIEYLDIFFLKRHLWFGKLDAADGDGREVVLRALIDGNGAGNDRLKSMLYKTLKDRQDVEVASGASLSSFLMAHLFASAYLEGLFSTDRDRIFWQIYPGSSPDSSPPPIIQATIERFKLFRSLSSLKNSSGLCRHTQAVQSHKARMNNTRGDVKFTNQMNSIVLTSAVKAKVSGKRVYVVDDFTTDGHSFEAARNLFYAAGARSVYLMAFGKYGSKYMIETPQGGVAITPTKKSRYAETDFYTDTVRLETDSDALTEFTASIAKLQSASIRSKLLEPSPR